MRNQQRLGAPVDNDTTEASRRETKQRAGGKTATRGDVCDTAGKPDSPGGA